MIRAMTINDYEELSVMWKHTPNMGLRSLDDSKEGIFRFLKQNRNTNFVAYENDRLVGAILSGHNGRRGYIYHTVVLPEYRGGKMASNLVEVAEEALQKEGITKVCFKVMETNELGKRFWTSRELDFTRLLALYFFTIIYRYIILGYIDCPRVLC